MSTEPKPRKKKSLFRKIMLGSGIFFLLCIILLVAAPFLFKDKLVQFVKDEANKQLNAKVDFGEFDLSIFRSFPDFRFNIQNVSVVGKDTFEGDTLIGIRELALDLNLMSVIRGENYQVNALRIEDPRALVQVTHDGKASWDIVKPSADTTAATPEEDQEPSKYKLRLSSLIINNAHVTYIDEQGGMKARVEDLDYELSGDFSNELLQSENKLHIAKTSFSTGGIAYLSEVEIKADAGIDIDLENNIYTFKKTELFLNELGLSLEGFLQLKDNDDMVMDLAFKALKADFKTILSLVPAVFTRDFASVQASGTVALEGFAKGTYSAIGYPAFGLKLLVENGGFKYPALPRSVEKIFIDLNIQNPNGNLDATLIDLNKLSLVMGGNPISMYAHVKTPVSDPDFDFNALGTIDLGSIKEFLPLEKGEEFNGVIRADIGLKGRLSYVEREQYDRFTARGSLEASQMKLKVEALPYEVLLNAIKLNFTNKFVELASFNALIGKSDISASGRIDNFIEYIFKDDLIKGDFSVNSNLLDINQLTASDNNDKAPAQQSAQSATPAEASTAPASGESSVIEIPANVDFVLNTSLKKVLYDNLVLDNVNGKVIIRNRRLSMESLKMNTLGGQMRMDGWYDTKNAENPEVNLNFRVENFDIATTYKTFNTFPKMAPIAQYASGLFTVSLENFSGKLNRDMEPDLNTISANGVLKTKSVSIGGFEPFVKLGDALKIDELKRMSFQNVNFSYKIKDGRAQIAPFDVKIDKVKATISGSHGFDQTIDYTWRMEIPRSLFGAQANATINSLAQQANSLVGTNFQPGEIIFVDVLFGGTATKPTIKTSLKESAKSIANEVKEQVIETVKEKAAEQVDKALEEARKQADKIKADARIAADKLKKEGYAAADKLVAEAKNPLAKVAAQKAADQAKKETDKKVQKVLDDADARADKLIRDAQAKSDANLKK